jgi:lambda family phage portal protein
VSIGSFIDGCIAPFAPAWAFRRAQFRVKNELLNSYAAAERSRTTKDWRASPDSADSAYLGSQATIGSRERLAEHDDWCAGSIVDAYRRHVVGTGITCTSDARDKSGELRKSFNDTADFLWKHWACRPIYCDFERRKSLVEIQGLAIAEFATVGQAFAVLTFDYSIPGVSPLRIRMFEQEQLDLTLASATNGNEVRNGIEIDADGRTVAYWVYDVHPYDYGGGIHGRSARQRSRRIPATQVLHLMRQKRPSQTHGISRLTRVLKKLRHAERFDEYTNVRARMEACIGLLIEKPVDADFGGGLPSVAEPTANTDGSLNVTMQPGMTHTLPPGYRGNFHNPTTPGSSYEPYKLRQHTEAAAGAGLDYATVARDYRHANFSSQRQSILERDQETDPLQTLLVDLWLQPIREAFITAEILEGRLDAPDFFDDPMTMASYLEAEWQPQGKPWIDPANQAAAAKLEIEQRLTPRGDIIQRLHGRPYKKVFDAIDDEQEYATQTLADEERPTGIGLPELAATQPKVDPREPKPRGATHAPKGLPNDDAGAASVPVESPGGTLSREDLRDSLDAYGVGVRAGSLTPIPADEDFFRRELGLPAISAEGKSAWQKDHGVRRPITLAPPGGEGQPSPFGASPAAEDTDPESQGDASLSRLNGHHKVGAN